MSAAFIAFDEWIREAEHRSSSSSVAGELFFALPEIRVATPEELAIDDAAAEKFRHWRARKARNQQESRARRRQR